MNVLPRRITNWRDWSRYKWSVIQKHLFRLLSMYLLTKFLLPLTFLFDISVIFYIQHSICEKKTRQNSKSKIPVNWHLYLYYSKLFDWASNIYLWKMEFLKFKSLSCLFLLVLIIFMPYGFGYFKLFEFLPLGLFPFVFQ